MMVEMSKEDFNRNGIPIVQANLKIVSYHVAFERTNRSAFFSCGLAVYAIMHGFSGYLRGHTSVQHFRNPYV